MPARRNAESVTPQPATPSRPKPSRSPAGPDEGADLQVEELEERIAPRLATNHNHTLLTED